MPPSDSVYVFFIQEQNPRTSEARIIQCARMASVYLSVSLEQSPSIQRSACGKPFFKNNPLFFSISHSGSYWLAAFASFPVGADIQEHRPCNMELISRRFHEKEQLWLAEHGEAEYFFRIWAAKESYVKLLGTGIDRSFGSFSVIEKDGMAHEVCGAGLLIYRAISRKKHEDSEQNREKPL